MLAKKIFLTVLFILTFNWIYAQRFSQYQTGTLFESFENPSRAAFIPDSSRYFAANFFIPNYGSFGDLSGNAQVSLKSRIFDGFYNSSNLRIGENQWNYGRFNVNTYILMLRMYTSLSNNGELGLSIQSKSQGNTKFTDESVAIFDAYNPFTRTGIYNNVLNDKGITQTFHQISLSYRQNVNKRFALGVKVSALLGVYIKELQIDQSTLFIDREAQLAKITLRGMHYSNFDSIRARDLHPSLRNPGAAISLGASYRFPDGGILQGNIKDLGFIHWNKDTGIYTINGTRTVNIAPGFGDEESTYKAFNSLAFTNSNRGSFTRMVDGQAELMYTRSFKVYGPDLKYKPALILSKELTFDGYTAALVNHFQYQNFWLSATGAIREHQLFDFGGQLMYKSPNVEFYVGSERLFKTGKFVSTLRQHENAINANSRYTGGDFFLGFSLKFGHIIEHPMNANRIPTGEPGFFPRLYNRFFKTRR